LRLLRDIAIYRILHYFRSQWVFPGIVRFRVTLGVKDVVNHRYLIDKIVVVSKVPPAIDLIDCPQNIVDRLQLWYLGGSLNENANLGSP
jgi:hypothetical protein